MKKIIINLSLLLATACNQPGAATNVLGVIPSPVPSPISVAPTSPSPLPTPVATASPSPFSAPIVVNPTPTPTATPIATPAPTGSLRPTIILPAKVDIAATLNAAKPNTIYQLSPSISYASILPFTINASNVTFDLNGSSISFAAVSANSSNISVRAPYFEFMNGKITSANRLIVNTSDHFYAHDLDVSGSAQLYLDQEAKAPYAKLDHITFAQGGFVIAYWTSDNFKISNSTLGSSTLPCSKGEYCLRSEIASGHIPANFMIQNVTAFNGNSVKKDTVGIRMGSGTIDSSVFYNTTGSAMRVGQIDTPTVGLCGNNPSVIIKNTKFMSSAAGSPLLSIDQGSCVEADTNTFMISNGTMGSMSISSASKVILTDNILKVTASGFTPKPIFNPAHVPASSSVLESGTKVLGP